MSSTSRMNQQTQPTGDIGPKKYKVYRIYSKDKNENRCYWGMSSEKWGPGSRGGVPRRIDVHIRVTNDITRGVTHKSYGKYIYQTIRETGGWCLKKTPEGKWTYELINSFDTKEEALDLENEMHEQDKNCCCALGSCQGHSRRK